MLLGVAPVNRYCPFQITHLSLPFQLAPEFRRLAKSFRDHSTPVYFGSVDCDAHKTLCNHNDIRSYPAIRLFGWERNSRAREYPPNWWRNVQSMTQWINQFLPSLVHTIGGSDDFSMRVLETRVPVLVDFFSPWCGHCVTFAPVFERMAKVSKATDRRFIWGLNEGISSVDYIGYLRSWRARLH